jgi:hypothetical protein
MSMVIPEGSFPRDEIRYSAMKKPEIFAKPNGVKAFCQGGESGKGLNSMEGHIIFNVSITEKQTFMAEVALLDRKTRERLKRKGRQAYAERGDSYGGRADFL